MVGGPASLTGAPPGCGPKDRGEVILNGSEAVGIVYRGVGRLVRDVSHAGQAGVVAPCVSLNYVAMQVSQCSGYLGKQTGSIRTRHLNCGMLSWGFGFG